MRKMMLQIVIILGKYLILDLVLIKRKLVNSKIDTYRKYSSFTCPEKVWLKARLVHKSLQPREMVENTTITNNN